VKFCRSIYVVENIKSLDISTEKKNKPTRPGFCLAPECYKDFLKKQAVIKLTAVTAIQWSRVASEQC